MKFQRQISVLINRCFSSGPHLTLDTLNPNIKIMQYPIRGPLDIRAGELDKELKSGVKKPFNEVIRANIGDCHAMGQTPITFIRQVLAVVSYPELLNYSKIPEDAKNRARTILEGCRGGSAGSYTDSAGIEIIRRHVAKYIEKRDGGIPSDWQNIVLSSGASDAIKNLLKLFISEVNGKKIGMMVPIPQYPLYSALLAEFNMPQIGYYLDESKKWALTVEELQRAVDEARKKCHPGALVVINPGNPTGQVLTKDNIEKIIKFAHKEKLFLFVDEVYQENVYDKQSKFYSFKKIMTEMGEPYSKMELASFMTCSKGYMGECGLRGGYVEVVNMDPKVKVHYFKALSAMLCPNVLGQATLEVVVTPPNEGEPSYEQFKKERTAILESLKLRAKMVEEAFNSYEGFSCNPVQGSMFGFPRIRLPAKACEAAKKVNQEADFFYAFALLERTGICVMPGSGFGQEKGSYHLRTTILPQPDKFKVMLERIKDFHAEFMKKYS